MRRRGLAFCESKSRLGGIDRSKVHIELAGLIMNGPCSNMLLDESLERIHVPLETLGGIIKLESHPIVNLRLKHAYLLQVLGDE